MSKIHLDMMKENKSIFLTFSNEKIKIFFEEFILEPVMSLEWGQN